MQQGVMQANAASIFAAQAAAAQKHAAAQAAAKQAQLAAAAASKPAAAPTPSRIYVGSVYFDIGEEEIKQVFQAFGTITNVSMIPSLETGKHKGYGFIEFAQHDAAAQAIQVMNMFTLGGRQLKVGWANSALSAPASFGQGAQVDHGDASVPGSQAAMLAQAHAAATAALAGKSGAMGSVQSEEGIGMSVSSGIQRAQIMAKLANRPSKVVLLKNMVDADDVDEQLEEEITEECNKFGPVAKVIIATLEEGGSKLVKIFVQFNDQASALRAVTSLHKRWFGGKVVHAQTYDEDRFARQDYAA